MADLMHDSDDEIIEDQAAEIVMLRVALALVVSSPSLKERAEIAAEALGVNGG